MDRTLTKSDSQVMKGIAILMMLLHHLFYSADSAHGLPVDFLLLNMKQMNRIAGFCKICVPVFVFITAYGMTVKYRACEKGRESLVKQTLGRYVSLMRSFLFVYVLMFLCCQIGGIRRYGEIYGSGVKSILYLLLDMSGLAYFTDTPTMNPTWWYMSVAILLIFALPLFWQIIKRTDCLLIVVLFALLWLLNKERNQTLLCLLTAAVGMWCAKRDIFTKVDKVPGILIGICLLGAMFYLKWGSGNHYWSIIYPISAIGIALLAHCLISLWQPAVHFFSFFGTYSMNMFLTHTFLKSWYLHDFIYGFRYPVLIFAALTILSLGLAMLLDWLWKHYNNVIRTIRKRRTTC